MKLHSRIIEKYEKILREYTVEKPKEEYGEDGKSIFDAIFGESGSENEYGNYKKKKRK